MGSRVGTAYRLSVSKNRLDDKDKIEMEIRISFGWLNRVGGCVEGIV